MANQKGNAALRTALQQLLSQVRTLIPKYQKLKKENKDLSTELSDERKETGDLRIKLDGKTKENENLDKKVKELEGQRGSSQGDEAAIDATLARYQVIKPKVERYSQTHPYNLPQRVDTDIRDIDTSGWTREEMEDHTVRYWVYQRYRDDLQAMDEWAASTTQGLSPKLAELIQAILLVKRVTSS
ncbi:hypothetical protein ZTR_02589 [Talaromyces verruculosus]|nr:hypothetical protein ZTR_02589 [Talaromyces verruculosus]